MGKAGRKVTITVYADDWTIATQWDKVFESDSRDVVRRWMEAWRTHMNHTVKVSDAQTGQILADMVRNDEPYVYQF